MILGREVSRCKRLQGGFLSIGFGEQSFQCGVLLLEFLQAFSVIGFRAAVLVAPPILGLLSNLEFVAYISHGFALCKEAICCAKLASNLFWSVALSLSTHRVIHSHHKPRE